MNECRHEKGLVLRRDEDYMFCYGCEKIVTTNSAKLMQQSILREVDHLRMTFAKSGGDQERFIVGKNNIVKIINDYLQTKPILAKEIK